jgi:pyruvate/2-oxoglutarate dehydrogenase complex dihydrolipoamide dehydrogenase (E3) component
MIEYDAIIIGTGQAGPSVATRLANSGWKVAIVERDNFGGTCVNNGCIPTKTLVASAKAIHTARSGSVFGFSTNAEIDVDMKKVKARKDAIAGESNKNVETWLRSTDNLTVYQGDAKFFTNNIVTVGNEKLQAEKIFLNVGAQAFVPPMQGLEDIDYFTNENIMEVDFVPEHLVIVGGSYIGLEFAQMYTRFGSKVTVIEQAPRLIPREDEDVSVEVRSILEQEGIDVNLGVEETKFARKNDVITLHCKSSKGQFQVSGSHVLFAIGRKPNTVSLGLDVAGVEHDERGYIKVDDELKTNIEGIWALGDCNGRGAFTHTSYNDSEIVLANLLDNDPRRLSDRIMTYGLFIDPPLGRVGMTETQARASGRKILIGKRAMSRVGRAKESSQTQGFMKVLVDAETDMILGAAILGLNGDEAIHGIIDIMYAKAPYTVIQRAVHIHPTVSELIPTMLGELAPLE